MIGEAIEYGDNDALHRLEEYVQNDVHVGQLPVERGWIVEDNNMMDALMVRKKERRGNGNQSQVLYTR